MQLESGIWILFVLQLSLPIAAGQGDPVEDVVWHRVAFHQILPSPRSQVYAGFPDEDHFLYVGEKLTELYRLNNERITDVHTGFSLPRKPDELLRVEELPLQSVSHCCRSGSIGELYGLTDGRPFKWELESGSIVLLRPNATGMWSNMSSATVSIASENGEVCVWNIGTGKLIRKATFLGCLGVAAVDSNNDLSVAGDFTGNVAVFFSGKPPENLRTVEGSENIGANAIQFSPHLWKLWIIDSNTVVVLMVVHSRLQMETWHRSSGIPSKWEKSKVVEISPKELTGLEVENYGPTVLCHGPRDIKFLDLTTGVFQPCIDISSYPDMKDLQAVSRSQSGQTIVASCEDGVVTVWRHQSAGEVDSKSALEE